MRFTESLFTFDDNDVNFFMSSEMGYMIIKATDQTWRKNYALPWLSFLMTKTVAKCERSRKSDILEALNQ